MFRFPALSWSRQSLDFHLAEMKRYRRSRVAPPSRNFAIAGQARM
jgi:hypothetical protein